MKTNHLLLALTFLTYFTGAYAADDQFADVLYKKTISLETATKWCDGDQPLSGVEEIIQEQKGRHKLPSSSRKYKKIYTGCVCPKGKGLYKFGDKESACPIPPTQEEICLLVVDPLAPKATDLSSTMLKITEAMIPSQLQPIKINPVKPVDEIDGTYSSLKLNPSNITPEIKKKVLNELPKLDLTMCKWGCENGLTHDALIFNLKRINEAAKQLKEITGKDLQLIILTDNKDENADKDKILKQMKDHYAKYTPRYYLNENLVIPEASPEGMHADYEWFMKYVAPKMTVSYVKDLTAPVDSPHIGYSYDFK